MRSTKSILNTITIALYGLCLLLNGSYNNSVIEAFLAPVLFDAFRVGYLIFSEKDKDPDQRFKLRKGYRKRQWPLTSFIIISLILLFLGLAIDGLVFIVLVATRWAEIKYNGVSLLSFGKRAEGDKKEIFPEKPPSFWNKVGVAVFIPLGMLFFLLILEFLILLFGGEFQIWLQFTPLFLGMLLFIQLQVKLRRYSFLWLQLILLTAALFFTSHYIFSWKAIIPTTNYGPYSLSERPIYEVSTGGWDWGEKWLRFSATPEELEIILQKIKCTVKIDGSYQSIPCLVKDKDLRKPHGWMADFDPYICIKKPAENWQLPDSIGIQQGRLPVSLFYDAEKQVVEIFEMTEF